MYTVPTSADELNKDWLKVVLESSHPESNFGDLNCQQIGEEFGFASKIYRLHWNDNGMPQSVAVKLWDTTGKPGTREVLFYQSFKDPGIRIPTCFYSAFDEIRQKAVLVLEDINNDVIQGEVLRQLNIEQAKGITENLAAMHAVWLEHPKLLEHDWITDVRFWLPDRNWFKERRALFLKRFPDRLDSLALSLLENLEHALKIRNDRLLNAPITLLHGDFHLDNIIFERQVEPVFIDWSRPLKDPLVVNLASLLFGMVPLEQLGA